VSAATGLAHETIRNGRRELAHGVDVTTRIRRAGVRGRFDSPVVDDDGAAGLGLPSGCEWPKDKKDQPVKSPPLLWMLRCVPTVVPDLIPMPGDLPDVQIDGPNGTRLIQLRIDGMPAIRLDYGPYPGTEGDPMLHLHLPMIWPDWHIPIDPRMWW
jgi:hypothetical protein